MTLSQTRFTHKDKIVSPLDELTSGQFFELNLVDGLPVELPVERFERGGVTEASNSQTSFDAPFAAERRRRRKEPLQ